jgi:hypothetical protein
VGGHHGSETIVGENTGWRGDGVVGREKWRRRCDEEERGSGGDDGGRGVWRAA